MASQALGDKYNLSIKQGADWSLVFEYREPNETTVVPLTGYTGRAQIRAYAGGPLLATFAVVIDAGLGKVTLSLTAAQTKALINNGVYDVELVNGSNVLGFLRGDVVLMPEVTLP